MLLDLEAPIELFSRNNKSHTHKVYMSNTRCKHQQDSACVFLSGALKVHFSVCRRQTRIKKGKGDTSVLYPPPLL